MVGLTCRVGAHNSRYAHDTRLYPIWLIDHLLPHVNVGTILTFYDRGDVPVSGKHHCRRTNPKRVHEEGDLPGDYGANGIRHVSGKDLVFYNVLFPIGQTLRMHISIPELVSFRHYFKSLTRRVTWADDNPSSTPHSDVSFAQCLYLHIICYTVQSILLLYSGYNVITHSTRWL